MKRFSIKTTIKATAEEVWKVLTDGPAYTSWDDTLVKLEGKIALGEKVKVTPKVNPKQTFTLKVVAFEPNKRMVWSGGMPLGLFKGERTYSLTKKEKGVEFSMVEEFSGLMAPLITRSIPDLQPVFEQFAAALKKRCEKAAARVS